MPLDRLGFLKFCDTPKFFYFIAHKYSRKFSTVLMRVSTRREIRSPPEPPSGTATYRRVGNLSPRYKFNLLETVGKISFK